MLLGACRPAIPFESLYKAASLEHNSLHWSFLAGQGYIESAGFNPLYVYGPLTGRAGEKGVGQFMTPTWGEWGKGSPWSPPDAINAQAKYLAWIDSYLYQKGLQQLSPGFTLLAYRHGPTGIMKYAARGWLPEDSRAYLRAIKEKAAEYRAIEEKCSETNRS